MNNLPKNGLTSLTSLTPLGMRLARLTGVVGLARLTSIVGVAGLMGTMGCSSNNSEFAIPETTGGTAGSGGQSGTGGASGESGTSGHAGSSAGASGTSGSSGTAGTSATGGSSGASGTAGSSSTCDPGLQDCDGDPSNGCEDTSSNPLYCGSCTHPCVVPAHATATCAGSMCGFTCDAGYDDCNGDASDGCEVNLDADSLHCGTCTNPCTQPPGASATCAGGMCGATCNPGFGDCNGDMGLDGCETDTTSDPNHCGVCETVCTSGSGGTALCVLNNCVLQCSDDTGDCDGDPTNGCEAMVKTDPSNCGSCGQSCDGSACVLGGCECAGSTTAAEPIPLDMYIMLDKSGSMLEYVNPPTNTITRWGVVTGALSQFVSAPSSTGLGVGFQFFPLGGIEPYTCQQYRYSNPQVSIGTLQDGSDPQETSIINALNAATPEGGTPSEVALDGALEHAKEWKVAHPTHKVIVVFATDGEPQGCGSTLASTANAAATGNSQTMLTTPDGTYNAPPIQTYVIGVGSALGNLDTVAQSGGTTNAFVLSDSGDPSAFIAAMNSIRKEALGCEYNIPPPPVGHPFDATKVNVKYTPGAGSPTTLTYEPSVGMCDPVTGGWYYDNASAPTKIILCDASCSQISSDLNGSVEVILGCASKVD